MEELRVELSKHNREILTMDIKMKALEDKQRNSEHHIRVLKNSIATKEEHYNLLWTNVEELRRNFDSCALVDVNQLKLEFGRQQPSFNKNRLQAGKLRAQLKRSQLKCKELEDRYDEAARELRQLQNDKQSNQQELNRLRLELQSAQNLLQRIQQDKAILRVELEKQRHIFEQQESGPERHNASRLHRVFQLCYPPRGL